jgi:hypothetical protein
MLIFLTWCVWHIHSRLRFWQHEISAVSKLVTDDLSGKANSSFIEEKTEEEEEKGDLLTRKKENLSSEPNLKRPKNFLFGQSFKNTPSKLTDFNVETIPNGHNGGATFSFRTGVGLSIFQPTAPPAPGAYPAAAGTAEECSEWLELLRTSIASARRQSSQVSAKRRLQARMLSTFRVPVLSFHCPI